MRRYTFWLYFRWRIASWICPEMAAELIEAKKLFESSIAVIAEYRIARCGGAREKSDA